MRICDWRTIESAESTEVSASIDDYRLWYRVPASCRTARTGDPFLAAALLPAMAKGAPIEVEAGLPVSPRFLRNTRRLQEIHHCWNPALGVVAVTAEEAPAATVSEGAFTFFSGGVDSICTFMKHRHVLTHAVFVHGFDFFGEQDAYQRAVRRNSGFVEAFGKVLVPVETNFYPFGYHHNLSRVLTQGSVLGSIALLLGLTRAFVPASSHYASLQPWGSHPLTDPLYSNEHVAVVHDGAELKRTERIASIAGHDAALAALTVCLENMNVNCGRCVKCLRTMTTLELLDKHPPSFPWPLSFREIRRVDWSRERRLLQQNIDLASRTEKKALLRLLRARQRRYERAQALKDVDRVLLNGLLKRIVSAVSGGPREPRRIDIIPPSA